MGERNDNRRPVIGILWWRSFARDRAPVARYEKDGKANKDLADVRQKAEATLELYKLSKGSTPSDNPWRVCELLTFNF